MRLDRLPVPLGGLGKLYRDAFGKAPRVTYVPVAETAHFVMLDQPAAFAKALDDFLK